ncbi:hypothetical protein BDW02DRAFT_596756 [Decorospora gaudefroyi]|uniref:SET domain-containing protein n=1 Tax=Decorospora gaudefroyi TaxID=184978 RepID=A0A6A5KR03_9PLEO|nr:hypothetical protein BDW02DRAFT_596756 [Decorospora gaudefroyi]
MTTQTQNQIFRSIRAKLDKQEREGKKRYAAGYVTKLLKQLYDPMLTGPRYFYEQDNNGLPTKRVPTTHEACIGCEEPGIRKCYCDYEAWADSKHDFWLSNMLLQAVGNRGFGLFARKFITQQIVLGEYTGMIIPPKAEEDLDTGADTYHTNISIGEWNEDASRQATTWIDALYTGSVLRFINHSCDPNARFLEALCGINRRVVDNCKNTPEKEGEDVDMVTDDSSSSDSEDLPEDVAMTTDDSSSSNSEDSPEDVEMTSDDGSSSDDSEASTVILCPRGSSTSTKMATKPTRDFTPLLSSLDFLTDSISAGLYVLWDMDNRYPALALDLARQDYIDVIPARRRG